MASITMEYRKSAEYQTWSGHILAENPSMPLYLVELAIASHISHPLAYRDKKLARPTPPNVKKEEFTVVEGAVGVHDSLPEMPMVKVA